MLHCLNLLRLYFLDGGIHIHAPTPGKILDPASSFVVCWMKKKVTEQNIIYWRYKFYFIDINNIQILPDSQPVDLSARLTENWYWYRPPANDRKLLLKNRRLIFFAANHFYVLRLLFNCFVIPSKRNYFLNYS